MDEAKSADVETSILRTIDISCCYLWRCPFLRIEVVINHFNYLDLVRDVLVMKRFLKFCLKLFVGLIAVLVLVLIIIYSIDLYSKQKELSYNTSLNWVWLDYPYQMLTNSGGLKQDAESQPASRFSSSVRKVDLSSNTEIIYTGRATENGDQLYVSLILNEACEEGLQIKTEEKYSDGKPYVLECVDTLRWQTGYSVDFPGDYNHSTKLDLGLLRVDEQLYEFDGVLREIKKQLMILRAKQSKKELASSSAPVSQDGWRAEEVKP